LRDPVGRPVIRSGFIMPPRIRYLSRYGNGAVAVLFAIVSILALGKGDLGIALFCAAVTVLCAFNVYVMEKAAALLGEEEWLKAEVRKAELRRKLVGLTEDNPENVGRTYGL
jgi:hypothetical protein